MSMYENVGMTSLDYPEEILQLRKALADVADECSKAYDKIAQLENPWISVEDRMPESGSTVLVLWDDRYLYNGNEIHNRRIQTAICCNENDGTKCFIVNDTYYAELINVTHWMPLPNMPEQPYEEWDRIAKEREG